MTIADEELPVLNQVIRTGNQSVIRSARLPLSDDNLNDSELPESPQFELPAHLQWKVLGDQREDNYQNDETSSELEERIDQIIDKHIVALRKDLRILLEEA